MAPGPPIAPSPHPQRDSSPPTALPQAGLADPAVSPPSSTSAAPARAGLSPPFSPLPTSRPPAPLPPRSRLTRVACEACRKRRTKCSGDRPRCMACIKFQAECHYTSATPTETRVQALKRKYDEARDETNCYRELYQYLHNSAESQALEILRCIRLDTNPAAVLRQVQGGDLLRPPTSPVNETRLRYEFPYRSAMPLIIQRSNNAYLTSILYEAVNMDQQDRDQVLDQMKLAQEKQEAVDMAGRFSPAHLTPYHAAKHVDPLLSGVQAASWTSVISDDALFATLISAYLVHEYPTFPAFQKDIFLRAMVEGDGRFCSPLLVNIVLAAGCHCHRGIPNRVKYWDPHNLAYRFLAEAKRLWELEMGKVSLVNAQAAVMLHIVYTFNALDSVGRTYLRQALSMGREMGLFTSDVLVQDQTMSDARLFTAWCIHRWVVIQTFHYQEQPLMEGAPVVALPDPDEQSAWFGDIYLQYPLGQTPSSIYHGHVFKALCDLRVIINDLGYVSHGSYPTTITAEHYFIFRERLERWFSSLPTPLKPENIIWPGQFKIHMEYYVMHIAMSRMQILETQGPSTATKCAAAARNASAEMLPYAVIRLETLVRLYYLRHSFEHCDSFIVYFLSTLVNIIMDSKRGRQVAFRETDSLEHLRSTLVLGIKGLADQGRHVYIAAVIGRLLLVRQAPEDVNMLAKHISMDTLDARPATGWRVHSAYPLHTGMSDEDPDISRLENLFKDHTLASSP